MTAVSDADLVARALAARDAAYAPYSAFRVGCALIAGGQLFTGANVENASYGLAICAERNAVAAAVLAGHRELERVAIASALSPPATPCGMCLQTLNEFTTAPDALRILLCNPAGERVEYRLSQLYPHGFDKSQLPGRRTV